MFRPMRIGAGQVMLHVTGDLTCDAVMEPGVSVREALRKRGMEPDAFVFRERGRFVNIDLAISVDLALKARRKS